MSGEDNESNIIHENAQTESPSLEEQIRQLELENHFFDILLETVSRCGLGISDDNSSPICLIVTYLS